MVVGRGRDPLPFDFYGCMMERLTPKIASLLLKVRSDGLAESVIDITRKTLDPSVFDDSGGQYVLSTSTREFIRQEAAKFSVYGEVENAFIVGSILSFQWSRVCDIDINVVIEPHNEEAYEKARQKAIDATDKLILPGTDHPVNFYVVMSDNDNLEKADGVYDVASNAWVKGPYSFSVDVNQYMDEFRDIVHGIDVDRGELYRDLIDYARLRKFTKGDLEGIGQLVREKTDEINDDVRSLASEYETIHGKRIAGFQGELTSEQLRDYASRNMLPANVIYKLLERYHYSKLLAEIKRFLRDAGGQIDEPDEIQKLAKVMNVPEARAVSPTYYDSFRTEPRKGEKKFLFLHTGSELKVKEGDVFDDSDHAKVWPVIRAGSATGRVFRETGSLVFHQTDFSVRKIVQIIDEVVDRFPGVRFLVYPAKGGSMSLQDYYASLFESDIESMIDDMVDEMTGSGAVASVERPIGMNAYYGKCTDRKRRKKREV